MTDDELDALIDGLGATGAVPTAPRPTDDEGPEEMDALIGGLGVSGPVPAAPPIPQTRTGRRPRWWLGGVALAAAALLAVGVTQLGQEPRVTARGVQSGVVDVVLEVVVDRGQGVERVGPGETIGLDDTLYFRVGATPQAVVEVWVAEAGDPQTIFAQEVGPEPQLVATDSGLVGYRPDGPGQLEVGARVGDSEVDLMVVVLGDK